MKALWLILSIALLAPGAARAAPPDLDAWTVAKQMGLGVNIGNTLDNTSTWETGWGNPTITKEYIDQLARLGFRSVRLPVAWDTYAHDGRIAADKLARVGEVVDWIIAAKMFVVVNIHWDGGWIDSSNKERFAATYATFSADAERKYVAYWTQIATALRSRDQHLLFEAINEETNFEKAGSTRDAFATLTRVNQLFIDTVRNTGGNNARRLLVVTGYHTDFEKTASEYFVMPKDPVPHKLLVSVHYYTPWTFVGMDKDESWGKMRPTWGTDDDVAELGRLFDAMAGFSQRNDVPVYVGEFNAHAKKDLASRERWLSAVADAAFRRRMVPVLWETGQDISRTPPYSPGPAFADLLGKFAPPPRD